MNPFLMDPQSRLADWKAFRKSLSDLPEEEQIVSVMRYWSKAPVAKHVYDLETPEELPSPWEMISAGDWCATSVAIGMEFTLRLAGWSTDRLTLRQIKDYDESNIFLLLIIDGQHVLNYTYGQVTTYPTSHHDVVGSWRFSGKFYHREA